MQDSFKMRQPRAGLHNQGVPGPLNTVHVTVEVSMGARDGSPATVEVGL